MQKQLTQKVIQDWITETSGWFSVRDLDRELIIDSADGKGHRRVIMHRLCEVGLLERHPKKNGLFRLVENQAPIIDWQSADIANTIDVRWPFKIEEYVTIYPKNIAVVAGSFNAGKTAFCLKFIAMNMHRPELGDLLPIQYFSSEMGPEEMKVRLSKFQMSEWAMEARERSSNFADVVNPNKINVIDYLEITNEFYLVSEEITALFNKLNKGIVLLALQKRRGAEMGRGAEFSAEKPRLYLSMDSGQLSIVKGKNWAVEGINPNGKKWTFKLVQGANFVNIKEVEI